MARYPAQEQLAEARMRIGAHYQQVTVKILRCREQACANDVVLGPKRRAIRLKGKWVAASTLR
jgi:hypothetical protein